MAQPFDPTLPDVPSVFSALKENWNQGPSSRA